MKITKSETETWNDQILFLKNVAHSLVQRRVKISSQFVKIQYLGSTVKHGMSISKARNTNKVQIGKGVCQGCILALCLFNVYTEYIMKNVRLDEAQAGIKLLREISIISDMQMILPLWQKSKRN